MSGTGPYQPPRQLGNYDVHEVLGKGGMAMVFRGEHRLLQRPVAIKFLRTDLARHASARQRFLREARLVARLSHPNIVTVFDFGELDDGTYYQASELVGGATLRDTLRGGPLDPPVALRFARQIAEGLASAHALGVIHRDLKPSNVMVVPDGAAPDGYRLKILDFGIAKTTNVAWRDAHGPVTRTGIMLGTPGYMSPEQCRGDAEIGPAADIYSLGVVLYVMLCGRPPFHTPDPDKLLERHLHEAPPRPSEQRIASGAGQVSSGVDDLVVRCLAKRSADRPRAMAEVIARIDDELAELGERVAERAASEGRPSRGSAPALQELAASTLSDAAPPGERNTMRLANDAPRMMRLGFGATAPATLSPVPNSAAPRPSATIEVATNVDQVSLFETLESDQDAAISAAMQARVTTPMFAVQPARSPQRPAAPVSAAPVSAAPVSAAPVSGAIERATPPFEHETPMPIPGRAAVMPRVSRPSVPPITAAVDGTQPGISSAVDVRALPSLVVPGVRSPLLERPSSPVLAPRRSRRVLIIAVCAVVFAITVIAIASGGDALTPPAASPASAPAARPAPAEPSPATITTPATTAPAEAAVHEAPPAKQEAADEVKREEPESQRAEDKADKKPEKKSAKPRADVDNDHSPERPFERPVY